MTTLILKRILGLFVTLLAVSCLIFFIMGLLPGDPAAIMLGTSSSPDTLAALQKQMGLDQPLPLRYVHWVIGVLHGDLGQSYTYGVPVAGLIVERLAVTLPLALLAVCLSVAIAIPLGVAAARNRNGALDFAAGLFSHVGIAVPGFWVGLLLIILFSTTLGWMPAGGFPGWTPSLSAGLLSLLLPAIALAVSQAGVLTRVCRSAVLEVMNEDFVRTARAKGLSERVALWRACGAKCDDPGRHHDRPAIHLSDCRRGAGGECLQPARPWTACLSGADPAGYRRHAVRRAVLLSTRHHHEFPGRYRLSLHRSKIADRCAMMRLLRRRPAFVMGIAVTSFLIAVALLSLVWTPLSPTKMQIVQKLKSPFVYGGLGTDHFGRDVLSMLMAGAWNSLSTAIAAVAIGAFIGTAIGVTVAAVRGFTETVVMRICDIIFAVPPILSAMMLGAFIGTGRFTAIIAIATFMIPVFARLTWVPRCRYGRGNI